MSGKAPIDGFLFWVAAHLQQDTETQERQRQLPMQDGFITVGRG